MRAYDMNIETGDELAAINEILASIGESPVNTLEGEANVDVANARRILNRVNRKVQSRGYTFNIEQSTQLIPDNFSRMIPYPPNYLSVLSPQGTTTYINRGGYVYDTQAKTDMFYSPIVVDLIKLRDFYELPECFRNLIITLASRAFNSRFFGAPEVDADLQEEAREARILCNEYEMDFGRYNMLNGDAYVQGMLTRG